MIKEFLNPKQTYLHGPSIDEALAVEQNGKQNYFVSNYLGSVNQAIDQSGASLATYDYSAFGKRNTVQQSKNLVPNNYAYTGREHDDETGMYYYRNRYYTANTSRFVTRDPILALNATPFSFKTYQNRGVENDFLGTNPYTYVNNNPLKNIDPLGLSVITVGCSASDNAKIQSAAAKADAASQACLNCNDKAAFRQKIRNQTIIHCTTSNISPSGANVCGYTFGGNDIYVTPNGLSGVPGCGCLQATVLHEVILIRRFVLKIDHRDFFALGESHRFVDTAFRGEPSVVS